MVSIRVFGGGKLTGSGFYPRGAEAVEEVCFALYFIVFEVSVS